MIAPPAQAVIDQNANFSKYCVTTQKRLDIGNYACALLFPLRIVFEKIIRSAPSYVKVFKFVNFTEARKPL